MCMSCRAARVSRPMPQAPQPRDGPQGGCTPDEEGGEPSAVPWRHDGWQTGRGQGACPHPLTQ
jgi:hypothetical protein